MTPDEKLREPDRVLRALIDEHTHGHVSPLDCNCVSTIARAYAVWALERAALITTREGVYGAKTIRSLAAQIGGDDGK